MTGAAPELRMFNLCRNMKWAHLPNAGGLYDQDPDLLEKFEIIFAALAQHEMEESKRQEEEAKKKEVEARRQSKSSSRPGRRPARIMNP